MLAPPSPRVLGHHRKQSTRAGNPGRLRGTTEVASFGGPTRSIPGCGSLTHREIAHARSRTSSSSPRPASHRGLRRLSGAGLGPARALLRAVGAARPLAAPVGEGTRRSRSSPAALPPAVSAGGHPRGTARAPRGGAVEVAWVVRPRALESRPTLHGESSGGALDASRPESASTRRGVARLDRRAQWGAVCLGAGDAAQARRFLRRNRAPRHPSGAADRRQEGSSERAAVRGRSTSREPLRWAALRRRSCCDRGGGTRARSARGSRATGSGRGASPRARRPGTAAARR